MAAGRERIGKKSFIRSMVEVTIKQVARYRTTPDGASPGPLKISKSKRFALQSRHNNL
jgi:hypothetical protein